MWDCIYPEDGLAAIEVGAEVANFLAPARGVAVGQADAVDKCHGLGASEPKYAIAQATDTGEAAIARLVCRIGLEEIVNNVREVEEVEEEGTGNHTAPMILEQPFDSVHDVAVLEEVESDGAGRHDEIIYHSKMGYILISRSRGPTGTPPSLEAAWG